MCVNEGSSLWYSQYPHNIIPQNVLLILTLELTLASTCTHTCKQWMNGDNLQLTASYRWIGWLSEIRGWSSKASGNLLMEESMWIYLRWRKKERKKDVNMHVETGWSCLEILYWDLDRSCPKNFARHWCKSSIMILNRQKSSCKSIPYTWAILSLHEQFETLWCS